MTPWWNVYRDGHISGPHYSQSPSGCVSSHRSAAAAERAAEKTRAHAARTVRGERVRSLEDIE